MSENLQLSTPSLGKEWFRSVLSRYEMILSCDGLGYGVVVRLLCLCDVVLLLQSRKGQDP